jgi:hypothetical protein
LESNERIHQKNITLESQDIHKDISVILLWLVYVAIRRQCCKANGTRPIGESILSALNWHFFLKYSCFISQQEIFRL